MNSQETIKRSETTAAFKYFRKGAGYSEMAQIKLRKNLKKLGWTLLSDSGLFSDVYENPLKPYVIKINKTPDPAYARYVKLIHTHPNIHFPKIGDMKRLKVIDENYFVYLIERLQPLSRSTVIAKIIDRAYYALINKNWR